MIENYSKRNKLSERKVFTKNRQIVGEYTKKLYQGEKEKTGGLRLCFLG